VRPVPEENLHLTAIFIGTAGLQAVRSISGLLGELAAVSGMTGDLDISICGLDAFPDRTASRIFLARVADTGGGLFRCHAALSAGLAGRGLEFDRRPYVPHITLGKLANGKPPPGRRDWDGLEPPASISARIAALPVIFESLPGPAGVCYRQMTAGFS
jgi:2'-5' RNA ligase